MKTMHLFAGIGGGLLSDRILGHDPIIAVEWESYACQVLRERAADGWFPNLQVWEGDVRMFDPSEYAGRVDCIHAGFPCQDISNAGKQAGVGAETRSGLYREVLRIAGVVRPRFIFLENVAAILSNGMGTVLGDLASLGYDARWICVRASDVGANHQRDRWWLLGKLGDTTKQFGNGIKYNSRDCEQSKEIPKSGDAGWKETKLAFPELLGCVHSESEVQPAENWIDALGNISASGENVAYTYSAQRKGNQRSKRSKHEHSDTSKPSWWEIEPDVGRVANGVSFMVERIKGLGNAQVPLQAAVAFKILEGLL